MARQVDSDIGEEALRRCLGMSLLEEIWAASPADLGDEEALDLANRELQEFRAGC